MGDRITFDPTVMEGQACIRGTRITASLVANLLANGMSEAEIRREYPDLEPEDIEQAARFASVPMDLASASRKPRGQVHLSPTDWRDQIVYFLLPDRFSDGGEDQRSQFDRDHPGLFQAPNLDAWRKAGRKFQGGTLKGVESKLDYLKDLGITTLWLGPVWRQRAELQVYRRHDGYQVEYETYHGYAIQNFLDVDPRFGTVQDLCDLVAAAHRRRIYVLLDIVYNHTGNNWFYDLDGQPSETAPYRYSPPYPFHGWRSCGGASSPRIATWADGVWPTEFHIPDWYVRAGKIGRWGPQEGQGALDPNAEFRRGDLIELKKLDLSNRQVLESLIHVYQYWIAVTDCDGFRIDTVMHIPSVSSRTFCSRIREFAHSLGKDDFLLLGEVGDSPEMIRLHLGVSGSHLDAALDIFAASRLTQLIKGTIAPEDYFKHFVTGRGDALCEYRETGRQLVSILDDHDMIGRRPRERFSAGNNIAGRYEQVAHAVGVQLTTLGIPCVYYGTEQAFDGSEAHHDEVAEPLEPDGGIPFGDRYIRESMFRGTFGAFRTADCHFFNHDHPSYIRIAAIARLRNQKDSIGLALRRGRQFHREIKYYGEGFFYPDHGGEITAWSRIHDQQEVLVVLNTHGTVKRGADITVDARLHPSNSVMTLLYCGDWDAAQLRNPPNVTVPVTHQTDGRATVRIDLPPAGMAILA